MTLGLDPDLLGHMGRYADTIWPTHPLREADFDAWLEEAREIEERIQDHQRLLDEGRSALDERERSWVEETLAGEEPSTFLLDFPEESRRQIAEQLSQETLVANLREFQRGPLRFIRARRTQIERMKRERDEPSREWLEAIEEIGRSELYPPIELQVQVGLVPLGPDPGTGFWEFGHWPSGTPPRRGADEELVLNADSSLVFVLLPRGTFVQGTPDSAVVPGIPEGPEAEVPAAEVHLDPFFLSKYELTRAQLHRLVGGFLEVEAPSEGEELLPALVRSSLLAPAIQLYVLELPTEAQWEYAARGGTSTAWWTGDEAPIGRANFAGIAGDDVFGDELAPVDAFEPNPFGLLNVLGNLSEWCLEPLDTYLIPTDPERGRRFSRGGSKVVRGGNYLLPPMDARSARRMERRTAKGKVGLRPARRIDPEVWVSFEE